MIELTKRLREELLKMICKTTHSPEETRQLAEKLASKVERGTVIAFFGDLGAGKTTFVSGLARGLGIDADVHSPTFSLVNEYRGERNLFHFDMYRIESWEDLYLTGFFEYYDAGEILACEWSENIENALPENTIRITIKRGEEENERIITIEGSGEYENFEC